MHSLMFTKANVTPVKQSPHYKCESSGLCLTVSKCLNDSYSCMAQYTFCTFARKAKYNIITAPPQ